MGSAFLIHGGYCLLADIKPIARSRIWAVDVAQRRLAAQLLRRCLTPCEMNETPLYGLLSASSALGKVKRGGCL